MTRTTLLLTFGLLVLATVAAGLVHGRLTNRWGLRQTAQQAVDRLQPSALPKECGSWRLVRDYEMSSEIRRMLENPAYFERQYRHAQTGDVVHVFVLAGHPGPVSVHTPEVCYSSQDYLLDGVRHRKDIEPADGAKHQFWELPLKPKDVLRREPLSICYAWSTGTTWEAAEHPRFGYAGLPHLYKLQMSVSVRPGSTAKGFDPAQDFLQSFLPQLQPHLVEGSRRHGSSS